MPQQLLLIGLHILNAVLDNECKGVMRGPLAERVLARQSSSFED